MNFLSKIWKSKKEPGSIPFENIKKELKQHYSKKYISYNDKNFNKLTNFDELFNELQEIKISSTNILKQIEETEDFIDQYKNIIKDLIQFFSNHIPLNIHLKDSIKDVYIQDENLMLLLSMEDFNTFNIDVEIPPYNANILINIFYFLPDNISTNFFQIFKNRISSIDNNLNCLLNELKSLNEEKNIIWNNLRNKNKEFNKLCPINYNTLLIKYIKNKNIFYIISEIYYHKIDGWYFYAGILNSVNLNIKDTYQIIYLNSFVKENIYLLSYIKENINYKNSINFTSFDEELNDKISKFINSIEDKEKIFQETIMDNDFVYEELTWK